MNAPTSRSQRAPARACWIYRGGRGGDTYLYLARRDDFDCVPANLRAALGRLELVMELTVGPERRLARARAADVLEALASRGWYLQLPPVDSPGPGRLQ